MKKFSIVCPAFNMEPWIAKTVESVISQAGEFEIEFLLMDGGSTDATVRVFEEYRAQLESGARPVYCKKIEMSIVSEKDNGTFDAINKGFARATGDIYTWCDADNTFEPGAFAAVALAFETFSNLEWVKGVSGTINEKWEKTRSGDCRMYRQDWIQKGIYGQEAYYIEQNGCFWSAGLWRKAGPIPTKLKVAGDYWLWMQLALHAPLVSLNYPVSNFMVREGQLHSQGGYKREQWLSRPRRSFAAWGARLFFSPQSRLAPRLRSFFVWLYPMLFMRGKKLQYIDIENGVAVKKYARSYLC